MGSSDVRVDQKTIPELKPIGFQPKRIGYVYQEGFK